MCIAPFRRVELADVIAADEGDAAIHDQQLAVIDAVAARGDDMQDARDRPISQRMDDGGKLLEGARHRQICKVVEEAVASHTRGGFACNMLFELLANGIALP